MKTPPAYHKKRSPFQDCETFHGLNFARHSLGVLITKEKKRTVFPRSCQAPLSVIRTLFSIGFATTESITNTAIQMQILTTRTEVYSSLISAGWWWRRTVKLFSAASKWTWAISRTILLYSFMKGIICSKLCDLKIKILLTLKFRLILMIQDSDIWSFLPVLLHKNDILDPCSLSQYCNVLEVPGKRHTKNKSFLFGRKKYMFKNARKIRWIK